MKRGMADETSGFPAFSCAARRGRSIIAGGAIQIHSDWEETVKYVTIKRGKCGLLRKRGADEITEVKISCKKKTAEAYGADLFPGEKIIAEAIGKMKPCKRKP